MFTGLVEATGVVRRREQRGLVHELRVRADLGPLVKGESIAVNGACLTVTQLGAGEFAADLSAETAVRTNLGSLGEGSRVNLERALRLGDRLGGHWVSGHVDAVVSVRGMVPAGAARRAQLELPQVLAPFVASKGSVTLDGVSLTVNDVREGEFEVMLIPHTLGATTLRDLAVGRRLNLEVDLLARYVVARLRADGAGRDGESLPGGADAGERGLIEALKRSGMM